MRWASCHSQTGQSVAPLTDSGYSVGFRHSTQSAKGGPPAAIGAGAGVSQYGSSIRTTLSPAVPTPVRADCADHRRQRQLADAFCGVSSLGRTITNPSPWSISWTASPEPPRIIEPTDCERCSEVLSWALQPTTASVSTYTGC